jgi:hypothetical protein
MSPTPLTPPLAITGIETAPRERSSGRDIHALQHAVARNIGENDRRDAGIFESPREIGCRKCRCLGPALDRNHAVARIDADCDAMGNFRADSFTSVGLRTAAVPRITRVTPASSQDSIPAASRIPPPSCTGNFTADNIARMMGALTE